MPRGIDDFLSTSSNKIAAFCFSVAFHTDRLSIDRLHVNRHAVRPPTRRCNRLIRNFFMD